MRTIIIITILCWAQLVQSQSIEGTFISKFDRRYKGQNVHWEKEDTKHEIAWKGERVSFQLLLWSNEKVSEISLSVSDFSGDEGIISKGNSKIRAPTFVKGDREARSCAEYPTRTRAYYIADALKDKLPVSIDKNDTVAIWISVDIPAATIPGIYTGKFTVSAGIETATFNMIIEVLPLVLPPRPKWSFHLDLWQFPTAGLQHYNDANPGAKIKIWSDAHFDLIRPAYAILADVGQKVITAHIKHNALGTPAMIAWIKKADGKWEYDFTAFDRYVSEMMALGIDEQISCFSPVGWNESVIPYWEESTQSIKKLNAPLGSEVYETRWDHFLTAFKSHLKEKGWFDITVLYLDEVSESKLKSVVETVHGNDPTWKLGIAYSHHLKDDTKSSFYDLSGIIEEASNSGIPKNKISTFYTSCTQTFPNSYVTIENSPAEMAWMAYYSANKDFDGYLRWAYDYWKNSDPLDIRDGSNTAGDFAFIYRSGNVLPIKYFSSIRLEMLREGIEDFEKIKMLREMYQGSDNPFDLDALKEIDSLLMSFDRYSGQDAEVLVPAAQQRLADISKGDIGYCRAGGASRSPFYFKSINSKGAYFNISYSQPNYPVHGYERLENQILMVEPGTTLSFEMEVDSNICFQSRVWMDWNFNEQFEKNEVIFSGNNLSNCSSGILTFFTDIPPTAAAGKGKIRFRVMDHMEDTSEPCGLLANASIIDIPFKVKSLNSILSVENDEDESSIISIYPNPFDSNISIKGVQGDNPKVQVLNLNGKIVAVKEFSKSIDPIINLSTNQIPKGHYIMIISTDHAEYREKVILE